MDRNKEAKRGRRKSYDHILPGYVFVSKYTDSTQSMDGVVIRCEVGDLCIVLERRLNNPVSEPDPHCKYTFVIQNLDKKLTFTVDRGFPYHIPINSPLAATLYC